MFQVAEIQTVALRLAQKNTMRGLWLQVNASIDSEPDRGIRSFGVVAQDPPIEQQSPDD